MMRRVLTTAFVIGCAAAALRGDEPPKGAKELFFDPSSEAVAHNATTDKTPDKTIDKTSGRRVVTAPAQRSLGISYWIELAESSGAKGGEVTSERTFKSGDHIRLHFRGNADGHIVIVQIGTSGAATVLFPDPSRGIRDNTLRANRDHILPTERVWFKFDDNSGEEKLLVFFAKTQAELDRVFRIQPVMDSATTAALLLAADEFFGGKDLIIETDNQSPAEVGTYAVNVTGRPVVMRIDLKHQ
jgi:hypothetical protein